MAKKTTPNTPRPAPRATADEPLTDADCEFIAHYLSGPHRFNAVQAAIGAGWDRENALKNAWTWRRKPNVDAALRHWTGARLRAAVDSLDRYTAELRALAYSRVSDVADWSDGTLRMIDPELVYPDALAAIAEVRSGPHGLGVKMHSKTDGLKQYGTLMGYVRGDDSNGSAEEHRRLLAEMRALMEMGEPDQGEPD